MKKIFLICLCMPFLALCSCASKKDRLVANTLTISIDPTTVYINQGATRSLTAICRSGASSNADVSPSWTVDSGLGSFSPTSGKTTTFTAGSTLGTGKIHATYSGVIGNASLTISTSATASGGVALNTSIYGIYSETYVNPGYNMLKYDTANPPNADGGCMGASGKGTISSATGSTEHTDGTTGLKCVVSGGAGGLWIQFGSDSTIGYSGDVEMPKDMSAFSGGTLQFDIKATADVNINMKWGAGTSRVPSLSIQGQGYPAPDGVNWQHISIPLAAFTSDLTQILEPVNFWAPDGTTFYVDNIYWQK